MVSAEDLDLLLSNPLKMLTELYVFFDVFSNADLILQTHKISFLY
jgi:hypothetical protein